MWPGSGTKTVARYVLAFLDRSIGAAPDSGQFATPWVQEQLDGPVETTRFSR